jgi:hypothetical protein
MGDPAANPAQNLEREDWLSCALSILPPDQRAVIDLTFYPACLIRISLKYLTDRKIL